VTPDWLSSGRFDVVVAGASYPARVSLRPFYDPDRTRVRG
jgi:hypothetical protein